MQACMADATSAVLKRTDVVPACHLFAIGLATLCGVALASRDA